MSQISVIGIYVPISWAIQSAEAMYLFQHFLMSHYVLLDDY
jgi:hypothetical protein